MNAAAWAVVAAPALAALIGLPVGRRNRPAAVGIGVAGAAIALLAALALAVSTWTGGVVRVGLLGPLDLGLAEAASGLDWSVSAPTALVCVAVATVALAVQVYSSGYLVPHAGDTGPLRYPPFAATVSLFTAAMLLVVGADDLLALLIGWEVMGFCSYLLVGHHSERPAAKRAALQAFLVTRVADIGFVAGILTLAAAAGTTNIPRLLAEAESLPPAAVALAMTGLVIGVAGKSAQFPFHGWLPDAMEGPTPVSALIHAATMVAAGVVVLVRLGPLLDRGGPALTLLAITACLSMLGAGLAALCSDDLKRVLAWSTVSQIAVMLAAVALGSDAGRAGALMLMLAHAAFKALLFLGAGMVAVRFGGTQLDGVADLWRRDRGLAVLLGVGLAGLAAVPPLAGFVGKEGVLTAAEHAVSGHSALAAPMPLIVVCCLGLTTLVTGLYSGRLFGALTRLDRPAVVARVTHSAATRVLSSGTSGTVDEGSTSVRTASEDGGLTATGDGGTSSSGAAGAVASAGGQPPGAAGGAAAASHPGPAFQPAPLPAPGLPTSPHTGPAAAPPGGTADGSSVGEHGGAGDATLSFVDDHGQVQDWDLIAHLDSPHPRWWSREGRALRARAAEEARRRQDSGLTDRRTDRLARKAPPRVRFMPGQQPPPAAPATDHPRMHWPLPPGLAEGTAQTRPATQPGPGSAMPLSAAGQPLTGQPSSVGQPSQSSQPSQSDQPPNRLARAMAGQRIEPTTQISETAQLDRAVPDRPLPDRPGHDSREAGRAQPPRQARPPRPPRPPRPEAQPVEPVPGPRVPRTMAWPVCVLAALTVLAGVLPLISPVGLRGFEFGILTAVIGTVLALAGVALGLVRGPNGHRDVATRLPTGLRAIATGGFGYQRAQDVLVVRPTRAVARLTAAGDEAVIGTWLQAPRLLPWAGRLLARLQSGKVSDYLGWVAAAVVIVVAIAGLAAKGVW